MATVVEVETKEEEEVQESSNEEFTKLLQEVQSRIRADTWSPEEKVEFERRVVQVFRSNLHGIETPTDFGLTEDDVLFVSVILGTANATVAAGTLAETYFMGFQGIFDRLWPVFSNFSMGIPDSVCAYAPVVGHVLYLLWSIYVLWRADKAHRELVGDEQDLIQWHSVYKEELNRLRGEVDKTISQLGEFITRRMTRLRTKDSEQNDSYLDVELSLDMVRCMQAVQYKMKLYRDAIDEGKKFISEMSSKIRVAKKNTIKRLWSGRVICATSLLAMGIAIASIPLSGGVTVPIVISICLCAGTTTTGGGIIHLSKMDYDRIKRMESEVDDAEQLIKIHETCYSQFEYQANLHISSEEDFVTEAEKMAEKDEEILALRRLLEERKEEVVIAEKNGRKRDAASGEQKTDDSLLSAGVYEVLARYGLENWHAALREQGVDRVSDLDAIDDEILTAMNVPRIKRKIFAKMVQEMPRVSVW